MPALLGFKPEVTCAIEVSDFARAKRWYQDVMGFQQIYSIDDIGWCEMTTRVPGVSVGVSQVEATHPAGGVASGLRRAGPSLIPCRPVHFNERNP